MIMTLLTLGEVGSRRGTREAPVVERVHLHLKSVVNMISIVKTQAVKP